MNEDDRIRRTGNGVEAMRRGAGSAHSRNVPSAPRIRGPRGFTRC